ncbi:MAG: hypothetical protein ACO1N5_06060 [Noviherbaspirillum sp.]
MTGKELYFKVHSFGIECYGASDMRTVYAGYAHHICINRIGRKKFPIDDRRVPLGALPGRVAFSSPVDVSWRTCDGQRHAHELILDRIFQGKSVLYEEDPWRIFEPAPFVQGGPTIIVETIGSTLNVYLDALIQLQPLEPNGKMLEQRRIRRLAYTRNF